MVELPLANGAIGVLQSVQQRLGLGRLVILLGLGDEDTLDGLLALLLLHLRRLGGRVRDLARELAVTHNSSLDGHILSVRVPVVGQLAQDSKHALEVRAERLGLLLELGDGVAVSLKGSEQGCASVISPA